eukprot:534043_1
MYWSLEKQELMYFSCLPAYILSIIGSTFIIVNFIWFSSLRTFSYKLVFFIAVSDLVRAIAMILPVYYKGDLILSLCWVQSILGNMAGLSTTLWNASVAHSIKSLFTADTVVANKLFCKYLLINPIITIILSIPPIFPLHNHPYGIAGSWCWIKDDGEYDSIIRIVCQYFVQLICCLYIIYVYWHFMRKLFETSSSISEARFQVMNETIGRLKWFPFVLIITYVPSIINRFSQIISKDHSSANYILTFTQYASLSICGLLDSLIYAWTKPVKQKYRELFPPDICCCYQNEHKMSTMFLNQANYPTFLSTDLEDTVNDGTGITSEITPKHPKDTYTMTISSNIIQK